MKTTELPETNSGSCSLNRLVRRIFPHWHRWETTHVNGYMLPTGQKCRCGMTRKVKVDDRPHPDLTHIGDGRWPRMAYRWEYSDGTHGPWLRMTDDYVISANANSRGETPLNTETKE